MGTISSTTDGHGTPRSRIIFQYWWMVGKWGFFYTADWKFLGRIQEWANLHHLTVRDPQVLAWVFVTLAY
jgi:hypothetical protein